MADYMNRPIAPIGYGEAQASSWQNGVIGSDGLTMGGFSGARLTSEDGTSAATPLFEQAFLDNIAPDARRWAWAEIDLNAIRSNVMAAKALLKPGVRLMAVVKADAYGHGAVKVARTVLNCGADQLAVATVDEGIALRQADITAPILMLSQPPESAIPLLLEYRVMPSIYTVDFAIRYAEQADALGMSAPFHLAINTGMNRIGVPWDEVTRFMSLVGFHRALNLVGTFTHFATADERESGAYREQLARFAKALAAMRNAGYDPGIAHCANTASTIRYPESHFDMVRFGIGLYGFHPSEETRRLIVLQPAMSIKARITDIRSPRIGEGVGYGLHFRCSGGERICTIPIGYADGLARALSGRMSVLLGGQFVRQVGNICMDQCMLAFDTRTTPGRVPQNPQVGDEVVLVGRQGNAEITMDMMAQALGTIHYELACDFGMRLGKVYR